MSSQGRSAALTAVLLLAALGATAQVTSNGGEFQVNTDTLGPQGVPDVAVDASGHFMVVWGGLGPGDADYGIFARRYRSAGVPLGPVFRVNTYTTGIQLNPSIAADSSGNFVVVWESEYIDGDGYGVVARRLAGTDADGTASPAEFQVNSYTPYWQIYPHVAMNATGEFVVAWQQDYFGYGLSAQRFANTGAPIGAEFLVNTYATYGQYEPEVGLAADGRFIVAWDGYGPGDPDVGVFVRRYAADGVAQGPEVSASDVTLDFQRRASLAVAPNNEFVVAWHSFGPSGDYDIFARRFDAAGAPTMGSFAVNSYTTATQFAPSVALDSAGNFLVTWVTNDAAADGDALGVRGRRFDANSVATSSEFRVNTYTTGYQSLPNVAAGGPDDFVVVWQTGPSQYDVDVSGQRYGDLIFSDGLNWGGLP